MSWHYLQELGADYLRVNHSAGEPSAPWKKSRIAEKCCSDDNGTVCFPCSQSGMTSKHSMASRGMGWFISLLRDSPVSHLVMLVSDKTKTTAETSGRTPFGLLEKLDPDSYCWKTSQGCFLFHTDTLQQFLDSFPKMGMCLNGRLYQLQSQVLPISESGSGYLPTPTASTYSSNRGGGQCRTGKWRYSLHHMARHNLWPTPQARDYKGRSIKRDRPPDKAGGPLNPTWVEWLMGWPLGWTDLKPLETESSRSKCAERGKC